MSLTIARRAPALLFVISVLACGSSGATSSPDGGNDGGVSPEGATPAPDGGGVCCPIVSDPCSACGGPWGGWAASASQCNQNGPCDGWIGKAVDDHGCSVIATGQNVAGAVCCGCPPVNDGGSDGDAGTSVCPGAPPAIASPCSAGLSCSYCDGGALCDCNAGQRECGGSTSCLPGGGGG